MNEQKKKNKEQIDWHKFLEKEVLTQMKFCSYKVKVGWVERSETQHNHICF